MDISGEITIHQQLIIQQIGVMVHIIWPGCVQGADSPPYPYLPDNWVIFLKSSYNHHMNIFKYMA